MSYPRLLTVLSLIMALQFANADDVIVMRDGDLIKAIITDITQTEIKYKKATRPNGPTYTINKSDVLAINYVDGEKETFSNESVVENDSHVIIGNPDNNFNKKAIDVFNHRYVPTYTLKDTNKDADYLLMVFGVTDNSVLADENIEIIVASGYREENIKGNQITGFDEFTACPHGEWFQISIKNKTAKTIYLDLQNSFINRGGLSQCYYVPTATTTGSTSGMGMGVTVMPGVSVGVGSSSSSSTTTFSQRIVTLAPNSLIKLEGNGIFANYNGVTDYNDMRNRKKQLAEIYSNEGLNTRKYYSLYANLDKNDKLKRGEILEFGQDHFSFRLGNVIKYSFDDTFSSSYVMQTEFFIKYLVGFHQGDTGQIYRGKNFVKAFPGCDQGFTTTIRIRHDDDRPTMSLK